MRKLLFLDFDGVLNHNDWWVLPGNPRLAIYPEPAAVANALIGLADEVVMISAWARWMFEHRLSPAAFSELLLAFGLVLPAHKIAHFGARADQPSDRAERIADYLRDYAKVGPIAYAVVDDCDMAPYLPADRFFRIDSRFMLAPRDYRAIHIALQTAASPSPTSMFSAPSVSNLPRA